MIGIGTLEDLLELSYYRGEVRQLIFQLDESVREVASLVGCRVVSAVGQRGSGFSRIACQQRGNSQLKMRFGVVAGLPTVKSRECQPTTRREVGFGCSKCATQTISICSELIGGVESSQGSIAKQSAVQPISPVGWMLVGDSIDDALGNGI